MSTVAGRAGGPARSSGEAPVIGVERRGRVVCGCVCSVNRGLWPGEELHERAEVVRKPFEISKWEVWEAYQKVKANKGAPGVDGWTIEAFETDLKSNLYKIWNRMSSGSYFPPPVRAVEIPKPHGGGTRMLGVPTMADRIAQTVVAGSWRRRWSRCFIPTPMAIGRGGRRWMRWRHAGSGVGGTTG